MRGRGGTDGERAILTMLGLSQKKLGWEIDVMGSASNVTADAKVRAFWNIGVLQLPATRDSGATAEIGPG